MNVVFINPPDDLTLLLGYGASLVSELEPLGILYVAAACRAHGHNVSFIDAEAEKIDASHLLERIREGNFEAVGFTSFTSNGSFLYTFGQQLKQRLPDVTVIFGNVHAEVYAHAYLQNHCCDIIVKGEGEENVPALLSALEEHGDLTQVPGLIYCSRNKIIETGTSTAIKDLDKLPLPARDLTNPNLYRASIAPNYTLHKLDKNKTHKHMFTSRGCVNRCEFCVVHKNIGIRLRSIDSVLEEIDYLVSQYNAGYIFFMDSLFTNKKSRIIELSNAVGSHFPNLRWGCEAHVNMVDEDIVRAMGKGGCTDMNFGIESGVNRLLQNVNKKQTTDQIYESITMVKRISQINCIGLFILGLPGESPADTMTTIQFSKKLPLDMAQFSILTPYPGSPLFNKLRASGELDDGIRKDGTIDHSVWYRYSAYASFSKNIPIWTTPEQTAQQLLKFQKIALREFYFRPKQIFNQIQRLHFDDYFTVMKSALKIFF